MADDKYFWSPDSDVGIEEYLKKTRPSITTDDMTAWIWVQGSKGDKSDPERGDSHGGALHQAAKILKDLETKLDEIEADDSIPVRGKKGVKSKKAVREEEHAKTKEQLKKLSIDSKWTIGKWLFFPRGEDVDGIWSTLATSVVKGPLRSAGVYLAKVAPAPKLQSDGMPPPQVICLYMDDVYDDKLVGGVLRTLLTEHGLEPSACKSDLYTLAGIDSNHPTSLRSSIWRTHELIDGGSEAIKKLKEEYRANRASKKTEAKTGAETESKPKELRRDGIIDTDSEDERVVQAHKRKSASPVKASEAPLEKKVKAAPPARKGKSAALKYQEEDIFGGGSDTD